MKKGTVLFLLIILALPLCLAACVDTDAKEIASISIRENSFRSIYQLESELDLTSAFIIILFSDGSTSQLACTADMVVGFDTMTTGRKQLYVIYQTFRSDYHFYDVEYEDGVAINTAARISYTEDDYRTGRRISLYFHVGELTGGISAVMLEIAGKPGFVGTPKEDFHTENLFAAWSMKILVLGESVRIVFYNDETVENRIMETGKICDLIVSDGERNRTVTIQNITIVKGDGSTELRLPDTTGGAT